MILISQIAPPQVHTHQNKQKRCTRPNTKGGGHLEKNSSEGGSSRRGADEIGILETTVGEKEDEKA